jgi:hypothetical protein
LTIFVSSKDKKYRMVASGTFGDVAIGIGTVMDGGGDTPLLQCNERGVLPVT